MGRLSPADFHAVYGLRRPDVALLEGSHEVCGLDYPFTLPRKIRSLGSAPLVSTPSRLECLSGLGSGLPFEVSPNLSSSASQLTTRAGCAARHLNVVNETQTNAQTAARYFPTTNTSNWPDSAVDRNS